MERWIERVKGHRDEADRGQTQKGIHFEKYHSVEMKPSKSLPIYQFKLYRLSDNHNACLFVKPDSDIIHHLDTNQVLAMKYLPKQEIDKSLLCDTRIKSISIEKTGPFCGFHKVKISVADEQ